MPEVSSVHVDAALTNVSVAFPGGDFVADRVFPVLKVQKQSDKYFIIDATREALRESDDARSPGTRGMLADYETTTDNYVTVDHAQVGQVPDEESSNADPAIKPLIDKTEFLTNRVLLNKEIALATALAAGVSNTAAASAVWSDYTNSDPITDVKTAQESVVDSIQMFPNTLWMDYKVFNALKDHPDIVDRIKYSSSPGSPAVASTIALAAVFGVENVLVGKSFKNTAAHGASASISSIWGTTVYLAFVAPSIGLQTATLGITFAWNPSGDSVNGWVVDRWRQDPELSNFVRVRYNYDQKLVTAAAAYKITSAI